MIPPYSTALWLDLQEEDDEWDEEEDWDEDEDWEDDNELDEDEDEEEERTVGTGCVPFPDSPLRG